MNRVNLQDVYLYLHDVYLSRQELFNFWLSKENENENSVLPVRPRHPVTGALVSREEVASTGFNPKYLRAFEFYAKEKRRRAYDSLWWTRDPYEITLLIDSGLDPNTKDEKELGFTLLHNAAKKGLSLVAKALLDHGADPLLKDDAKGRTALHWVICGDNTFGMSSIGPDEQTRRLNIALELLERGGDINATDKEGCTPLHYASGVGFLAMVELLVEKGAQVNARDVDDRTPLYAAARQNFGGGCWFISDNDEEREPWLPIVRFLVARGADLHARTKRTCSTLIYAAVSTNFPQAVQFFLDHGVDANEGDTTESGLHIAVRHGWKKLICLLLAHGADANATSTTLGTPLHQCDDADIATLLLNAGADANAPFMSMGSRDDWNVSENYNTNLMKTSLYMAVERLPHRDTRHCTPASVLRWEALLKVLGENGGADVSVQCGSGGNSGQDAYSGTALHVASRKGWPTIVRLLLNLGADVNAVDSRGWTALHVATKCGFVLIADVLLGASADVSVATPLEGITALHMAAFCGHRKMIRLLLERGADASAADAQETRRCA